MQKIVKKFFKILKQLSKEKLVIVISHDEILAKKYHDYLYEIKDYQLKLIHQNPITQRKKQEEKTSKRSFLQFILKELKMNVEEFFYCCTSFIFSTFEYFIDPFIDSINTKTNSSAIRTNYSFNNHYVKKEK